MVRQSDRLGLGERARRTYNGRGAEDILGWGRIMAESLCRWSRIEAAMWPLWRTMPEAADHVGGTLL